MAKDHVVKGDAHGVSAPEQAKKARGKKADKTPKDAVNSAEQSAMDKATTPKEHAADVKHEARSKRLEAAGEKPGSVGSGDSNFKTGKKVVTKLYQGDITARSVSHETGEEVSARFHVPEPVTEEGIFYRLRCHHNSAMRDHFKIDPQNKSDPLLSTHLE